MIHNTSNYLFHGNMKAKLKSFVFMVVSLIVPSSRLILPWPTFDWKTLDQIGITLPLCISNSPKGKKSSASSYYYSKDLLKSIVHEETKHTEKRGARFLLFNANSDRQSSSNFKGETLHNRVTVDIRSKGFKSWMNLESL